MIHNGDSNAESSEPAPLATPVRNATKPTSSVARSSLIMTAGTLVSRILGMVRSPILLTMVLGLNSPVATSFDVANTLPNILFGVIASGLINAVLVPAIVRASKNGPDAGAAYINKLLTIAIVMLGTATLILTLLAPVIVKAFAATLNPTWYEIAIYFAYWCLPQVFFYGLYTVIGQILNARENFGPYMWVPVANNVVAIIGLLILLSAFATPTGIDPHAVELWQSGSARATILAAFSTAGIAVQALLLIIPLRHLGIRFRFDFHWRGAGLRATGKTSLWALANTLVGIVPIAFQTNVAAGATQRALDAGMNVSGVAGSAAVTSAYAFVGMPISLVTLSIVTAVFTKMADAASDGDMKRLRYQTIRTTNTVSLFNFLATTLFIVLSIPLSRILVPSGDHAEVMSLAWLMIAFSPSIIFNGIILVLDRVCYSLEDTRGVFLMALPAQAVYSVSYFFSSLLPPEYTGVGIGVSIVVGNVVGTGCMTAYVYRKLGGLPVRKVLHTHLQLLAASVVVTALGMGVVAALGFQWFTASIVRALLVLIAGGVIVSALYVLCLKLLRIPEYSDMQRIFGRMLGRLSR